jgi:hypothetical protein
VSETKSTGTAAPQAKPGGSRWVLRAGALCFLVGLGMQAAASNRAVKAALRQN